MGEEMGGKYGVVVKVWDEKNGSIGGNFRWGCNGSGASILD